MLEYTSASVHSICTSFALPSDLLRRTSAVVIEQAKSLWPAVQDSVRISWLTSEYSRNNMAAFDLP